MAKRSDIIQAAFSAWGKNRFCDTSLSLVAAELGMTKPALYRHFKNKADLLAEMDKVFLKQFLEVHSAGLAELKKQKTLEDLVRNSARWQVAFFTGHPELFLYFITHFFREPIFTRPALLFAMQREIETVRGVLKTAGKKDLSAKAQPVLSYVYLSITFALFNYLRFSSPVQDQGGEPTPLAETEKDPAALEAAILGLVMRGLANQLGNVATLSAHELDAIEASAAAYQGTELPQDRILDAIEAAISEEGPEKASLEKIASRAGMTKSSLYFHFKNRDDMMLQAMTRIQDHFLAVLEPRVAAWEGFAQRSYAVMTTIAVYMYRHPNLFALFNWVRLQGVQIFSVKPSEAFLLRYTSLIMDALPVATPAPGGKLLHGMFLHMLSFRQTISGLQEQKSLETVFQGMRDMHLFYLYGLSGADRTVPPGPQKEHS